jgi:conjugative transfer region protein TrbK
MTPAMSARIAAAAFIALAIAVAVIELRGDEDDPVPAIATSRIVDTGSIQAQLLRCQSLGEAGAHDADCLRAWSANRRRFLTPGVKLQQRLPTEVFPNTSTAPHGATGNTSGDQPAPKDE